MKKTDRFSHPLLCRISDVVADEHQLKFDADSRRISFQWQIFPIAGEAANNWDEGEERNRKYDPIDLAKLSKSRQEAAGGSVYDARRLQSQNRISKVKDLEGQTESPIKSSE